MDGTAYSGEIQEERAASKVIQSIREDYKFILVAYPPFLYLTGIPGNLLTFFIIRTTELRRCFVAAFLEYLVFFNLLNLCIGLSRYWVIGLTGFDILLMNAEMCRVFLTVNMVGHLMSNHILVVLGVCKVIHIIRPEKVYMWCYRSIINIFLLVMMSASTLIIMSTLRDLEIRPSGKNDSSLSSCQLKKGSPDRYIQMILTFYVPDLQLIILNITIQYLYYSLRKKFHLQEVVNERKRHELMQVQRVALVIFVSDLKMILMEIPYAIVYSARSEMFPLTPLGKAQKDLAYAAVSMLLYTKYSINFFIYCFFGHKFRLELKHFFISCVNILCPCRSCPMEMLVEQPSEHTGITMETESDRFIQYYSRRSLEYLFDVPLRHRVSTDTEPTNSPLTQSSPPDPLESEV